MDTGTIKFFNASKGFGFVTPDNGRADVFLPGAVVIATGIKSMKPGQRIAFEQAPDAKGPKVASLKLIGDAPIQVAARASEGVTIYCDANADVTADIVAAVINCGFSATTQDYISGPPSVDQLKRLSQILSASGQSLVRRYDPLFLALRLDDRFITDQDFWIAIVEHPSLINGPVLTAAGRARVCGTAGEVRAFLRKDDAVILPKPKTLSPRIAAMLRGEALPDAGSSALAESPSTAQGPSNEKKARSAAKAAPKLKSGIKLKKKRAPAFSPKKASAKRIAKERPVKRAKSARKKR